MSSSAKHQLSAAAATTGDKQKDGSTSVTTSTATPKEMDTASRVSEQLVKQVEVSYSPNSTSGTLTCSSLVQHVLYSEFVQCLKSL